MFHSIDYAAQKWEWISWMKRFNEASELLKLTLESFGAHVFSFEYENWKDFDKNENKVDDEEKKKLRSMVEPVA